MDVIVFVEEMICLNYYFIIMIIIIIFKYCFIQYVKRNISYFKAIFIYFGNVIIKLIVNNSFLEYLCWKKRVIHPGTNVRPIENAHLQIPLSPSAIYWKVSSNSSSKKENC